jgi:hypothetical protein
VVGEQARLAPLFDGTGYVQQTPEQVFHGHAPGFGPDYEADLLEKVAGKYEDVPGWWNAAQFAEAGAQKARERADNVLAGLAQSGRPYNQPLHLETYEEEFRKNRHLLSQPQFEYMQTVGRYADLLRGLRKETPVDTSWRGYPRRPIGSRSQREPGPGPAETALQYWDKSNLATRAREDFGDPNYQRFAGGEKGFQSFFSNPDSPLVQYFQAGQMIPNAMKFAWESPATGQNDEALQRTGNQLAFSRGNMLSGENPVLRQPVPPDQYEPGRWSQALREAGAASQNLQPPPWQNIANSGWRAMQSAAQRAAGIEKPVVSDATAAAGDLLGLLGDSLDPSLIAGASVGVPLRARVLSGLARSQGRAPSAAPVLGKAIASQAYQEGIPEVALGGSLNAAFGDPSRTVTDYLTKPQKDVPLDPAARAEAHRQEEIYNLKNQQSIPDERRKAYYRYLPGAR